MKDQQSVIPTSVAYLTYLEKRCQPRHGYSIPHKSIWLIIKKKSNLKMKNLRTNQSSNFLGGGSSNRNNSRTRNIMQFQIKSGRKAGKEIHESLRLRVFRKVFRTQSCFTRSKRQHHKAIIKANLTLLRTLLLIRQMSLEWDYKEVIESFVLLANLATSRTFLQQLLACLKFT